MHSLCCVCIQHHSLRITHKPAAAATRPLTYGTCGNTMHTLCVQWGLLSRRTSYYLDVSIVPRARVHNLAVSSYHVALLAGRNAAVSIDGVTSEHHKVWFHQGSNFSKQVTALQVQDDMICCNQICKVQKSVRWSTFQGICSWRLQCKLLSPLSIASYTRPGLQSEQPCYPCLGTVAHKILCFVSNHNMYVRYTC